LLKDLKLDYYSDLSGGGFLISTPKNAKRCACGSGFKLL
jgi:Fe-S cluster assembly iron-binding protein IscA